MVRFMEWEDAYSTTFTLKKKNLQWDSSYMHMYHDTSFYYLSICFCKNNEVSIYRDNYIIII